MKKHTSCLAILLLISVAGLSQPVVNRAGPANTVQDANLFAQRSMGLPRYSDTTQANSLYSTLDTCGKLIYTYSDNLVWQRSCMPGGKRWTPLGQRFGLEDNNMTSDRRVMMNLNNFRYDSGQIILYGSRNNPSDSAFMVTKGGLAVLRVDNQSGTVYNSALNAGSGIFTVDGATTRVLNNTALSYELGGYTKSFQQPLSYYRNYPITGAPYSGLIIRNDTLGTWSDLTDTAKYNPFEIRFTSFADATERTKFVVNQSGYIWSANFPSGSGGSTDSALVIKNGIISSVPYSTFGGGGGGGSVTGFSFLNGGGFVGSVTNPTTTPALQLTTSVGDGQVVVANGGALTGSNNFTRTAATIYGYVTNDVNFEAESGTDINGLQIIPTKSLFYNVSSSANTVETVLELRRLTGTSSNGIGGALDYMTENDGGTIVRSNRLQSKYTSVISGATTSEFAIYGMNAGAEQLGFTLAGTGAIKLHSSYGSNTFTGVPAYNIAVDASGNMITSPFSGGDTNWVYLSDYAIPNDGLSDTTGIKNALATGKNVYVTPGTWLWDGYRATILKGQIVRGYGLRSIIQFTKDTCDAFYLPNDSARVEFVTFVGKGRGNYPGGETFTYSNGIYIQGNSNTVRWCNFFSAKGAAITLWNSTTMYNNRIENCDFDSCTIGVYMVLNAEYSKVFASSARHCRAGFVERCSGNNKWDLLNGDYCDYGFRLASPGGCNGDHGSLTNSTFNHATGAGYSIYIESAANGYSISNIKSYFSNVAIGVTDTARQIVFRDIEISTATITTTKAKNCQWSGGSFQPNNSPNVTVTGTTGIEFCSIMNSVYQNTTCGGGASLSNPMTTEYDIIVAGVGGTPGRLGVGADGTFLGVSGGVLQYLSLPGGGNVNNVGTPLNNQIPIWTGATTIEGDANFTWDASTLAVVGSATVSTSVTSPLIIGTSSTTAGITYKASTGNASGANPAHTWTYGNNGASQAMRIDHNGTIGIGTNPSSGFKMFIVSGGNTSATGALLVRNSSSTNMMQLDDGGNWRMGNQSAASTGMMYYRTAAGTGTVFTPTSWLHLGLGGTGANTNPLKFTTTSAALNTTPEAGAVEVANDKIYYVIPTGTARKPFALADPSGGLTSGRVAFTTTDGRLTDANTLTTDGTNLGIGGSPGSSYNLSVTGSTATLAGVRVLSTIAAAVSGDGFGVYVNPVMTEQGSGTHGMFASLRIAGPSVTAGAATLTRTAGIFLSDNSNGSVTDNNYAIYSTLTGPTLLNGDLQLGTIGNKITIATGGVGETVGTTTLISGTKTVSNTSVTASSLIFVVYDTPSGTLASGLSAPSGSIVAGTSFVINSLTTGGGVNTADNSTVRYWIIN